MPRPILLFTVAILALTRFAHADDARVKAELEATFADMAKAVLAGDADAYIAHIDANEARLLAEQKHWIAALAKDKPAEFSLSIPEGPATFSDTTAEAPLTMSWRFENGNQDNWGMSKPRTVKFPTVQFVKRDGRWLYKGEKWKEVFSEGGVCSVRFLPGSEKVAEDVFKAFPTSKGHVDAEFDRPIAERQTIELFQSMDHLKATVFITMPDQVLGGWSEPGESIKFMDTYTRGVTGWTAAFAHEYAHVATWEVSAAQHALPWWAEEGIAELCACEFRPGYIAKLDETHRKLAADNKLQAWDDLSDYMTAKPNLKRLAYTQGNHMAWYITERFKKEGRIKWVRAMGSGKTLDEATQTAFGISFEQLDKDWRESLKSVRETPEPEGLRESLDQLLREMTAATAAADQTAYLARVASTDAVFYKEQQNWVRDLARAPVEHVELTLDPKPLKMENDAAVGILVTKWRMPGAKDRSISYPARFVRGEVGWAYAGENWLIHEGDHSKVFYEDESLKETAQAVAEILPDIRAHVHEGFELSDNKAVTERIQQVKLYTSMKHLQHSIYLSYVEGLSGWNEPDESIKILASPRSGKAMLRSLLGHEYGHVATFCLGPKANDMPWWILEGVAELSAEEYSRDGTRTDRMVKRWAQNGGIVDWDKLADFHGEALNYQQNVYTQGHHMVSFISETFGRHGRNAWMTAMAKGAKLEEATKAALGVSFDELDKKWRASIAPAKEEPAEKHPE